MKTTRKIMAAMLSAAVMGSLSAAAFVAKVQLRKPGLKFILVLVGIGALEAIATLLVYCLA